MFILEVHRYFVLTLVGIFICKVWKSESTSSEGGRNLPAQPCMSSSPASIGKSISPHPLFLTDSLASRAPDLRLAIKYLYFRVIFLAPLQMCPHDVKNVAIK